MRAVWTFWTKPFEARQRWAWRSRKHHLLAWVLSLETARKHYAHTVLFTDDAGARMLVDGLGLDFAEVRTDLNALDGDDAEWWVLGKLHTYAAQTVPFVHLDNDVFLWNPLPESLASAPVFAQNPERFDLGNGSWYQPEVFTAALDAVGGWLPEEWRWYTAVGGNGAVSCGLIGGNRTDFIRYYAELALDLARHPANRAAWDRWGDKVDDNILIEQYFLSACLEYHQHMPRARYRGIDIRYLFPSVEEAFDADAAAQAGYTHLIGNAKRDNGLTDRLERRVRREYPEHYARCLRYLGQGGMRRERRAAYRPATPARGGRGPAGGHGAPLHPARGTPAGG